MSQSSPGEILSGHVRSWSHGSTHTRQGRRHTGHTAVRALAQVGVLVGAWVPPHTRFSVERPPACRPKGLDLYLWNGWNKGCAGGRATRAQLLGKGRCVPPVRPSARHRGPPRHCRRLGPPCPGIQTSKKKTSTRGGLIPSQATVAFSGGEQYATPDAALTRTQRRLSPDLSRQRRDRCQCQQQHNTSTSHHP